MKKASEYRKHAEECRQLSNGMNTHQRAQMMEMAATWETLAEDRSALVRRHPELALEGEYTEEISRKTEPC